MTYMSFARRAHRTHFPFHVQHPLTFELKSDVHLGEDRGCDVCDTPIQGMHYSWNILLSAASRCRLLASPSSHGASCHPLVLTVASPTKCTLDSSCPCQHTRSHVRRTSSGPRSGTTCPHWPPPGSRGGRTPTLPRLDAGAVLLDTCNARVDCHRLAIHLLSLLAPSPASLCHVCAVLADCDGHGDGPSSPL